MTSRSTRFRAPRLGACLALLALFAQLWIGQISTGHQARLLAVAAASDICSVSDPAGNAPGSESAGEAAQPVNCPVCVVAAAGVAPAAAAPAPRTAHALATVHAFRHREAPRAPRRAGLRPPAQAPPAA
ncbi:DUF2946 family protein [Ramlibacter sp.]|uniref:DUF2946 family protein n=1 Tax=Ramlibacter sp. TaxID=1917967 RepID=UPI002FC5CAA8